jgi:hypothetical protein
VCHEQLRALGLSQRMTGEPHERGNRDDETRTSETLTQLICIFHCLPFLDFVWLFTFGRMF